MARLSFRNLIAILLTSLLLASCNGRGGNSSYSNKTEVDSNDYVAVAPSYDYAPQQQSTEQDEEDYELPDLPNASNSYSDGDGMSEEERYFAQFSNFEPSYSDKKGVVVYEGQGDYYIIETGSGYVIAERYSGILYEDQTIYGRLHSYGSKYFINLNRDSEVKLYIEDYMLTQERAVEWMGEHNKLKYSDQSSYDEANSDW